MYYLVFNRKKKFFLRCGRGTWVTNRKKEKTDISRIKVAVTPQVPQAGQLEKHCRASGCPNDLNQKDGPLRRFSLPSVHGTYK